MADTDPGTSRNAAPENDDEFKKRYGEQVGSGMSAVVYARDGIAAKVYRAGQPSRQVFQEAFTLAAVAEHGIPAPKVYGVETFHGRTTLLMDLVKGESLMDIMTRSPERTGECIDKVVELQVAMHKVVSSHFRPIKLVLMGNILAAPGLDDADRERLIPLLSTLPDGLAVLHGDFHGGNILFDGSSYMIIDWAEVALGDPAADVARSYMDYLFMDRKDLSEMHLAKYCAGTGISKEQVLAWLPVMAGSLYGFLSEDAQRILRPLF
ncbi:phosphotransferase family protein [Methanosphaerula subterraneus]|uniref:phosphotransferase family protein n=1 Tax=Methanosphaerula subterraneus TaxID=3350244 RepID=UPI003F8794B2